MIHTTDVATSDLDRGLPVGVTQLCCSLGGRIARSLAARGDTDIEVDELAVMAGLFLPLLRDDPIARGRVVSAGPGLAGC